VARFNFLKGDTTRTVNIDIRKFFEENFPCKSKDTPFIDEVKEIIIRAFPHYITIDEIATKIQRNKKSVQRMFINVFGIKYIQMVETLRIYCAIALLQRTRLYNTGIAIMLNYSDLSGLDRDFNKVIGISPNKVRILLKNLSAGALFRRYYRYKILP